MKWQTRRRKEIRDKAYNANYGKCYNGKLQLMSWDAFFSESAILKFFIWVSKKG